MNTQLLTPGEDNAEICLQSLPESPNMMEPSCPKWQLVVNMSCSCFLLSPVSVLHCPLLLLRVTPKQAPHTQPCLRAFWWVGVGDAGLARPHAWFPFCLTRSVSHCHLLFLLPSYSEFI